MGKKKKKVDPLKTVQGRFRKEPSERIRKFAYCSACGIPEEDAKVIAGFSPRSSPSSLKKTRGYDEARKEIIKEINDKGLTADLIAERLKALLLKKDKRLSFGKVKIIDDVDKEATAKGLDMLFKLRGDYSPEKFEDVNPIKNVSITDLLVTLKKQQEEGKIPEDVSSLLPDGLV